MTSTMPNDDAMEQGLGRVSAKRGVGGVFARGAHADGRAIASHIEDLVELAGRVEQVRQAAAEAEARRQDHYLDGFMGEGYSFQEAQALAEQMWAQESGSMSSSGDGHDAVAGLSLEDEQGLYLEGSADCAFDQEAGPDPLTLRLYAPEALDAALRQFGKDRDRRVVRSFLSEMGERGPDRALALAPCAGIWPALAQRFPNFAEVLDYLAGRAALANLHPCSPLQFPPLLIEGEPGIGKTAFATALADAMAVPFIALPMAHSNGPFMVGGLDASFEGGGPGLLARSVALGQAVDPVVLLDEVDKVSLRPNHDPLGPLYSLWESHTAERFQDEGLPLTLNLSAVRWIATANGSEGLHPALRSRCQVFRIAAPTPEQAKGIAQWVYADLVAQQPWGRHFEAELPESVADLLAQSTPRELRRRLTDAFAMAARAQRRGLQVSDIPVMPPASRRTGFL